MNNNNQLITPNYQHYFPNNNNNQLYFPNNNNQNITKTNAKNSLIIITKNYKDQQNILGRKKNINQFLHSINQIYHYEQ